ncbi:MAG: hypothetical protein L0229_29705 [Blastocatellia bacterium]|nr:hypothetical protein [Blastocatellia bacterium]
MGNTKTEAGKRWRRNKRERPRREELALVEKRNRAATFILNHAPASLVDEIIRYQEVFKGRQRALDK